MSYRRIKSSPDQKSLVDYGFPKFKRMKPKFKVKKSKQQTFDRCFRGEQLENDMQTFYGLKNLAKEEKSKSMYQGEIDSLETELKQHRKDCLICRQNKL